MLEIQAHIRKKLQQLMTGLALAGLGVAGLALTLVALVGTG